MKQLRGHTLLFPLCFSSYVGGWSERSLETQQQTSNLETYQYVTVCGGCVTADVPFFKVHTHTTPRLTWGLVLPNSEV